MSDYQYDSSKENSNTSDTKFWVVVGLFFVLGLWPISVILMIVKLTNRKKHTERLRIVPADASYEKNKNAKVSKRTVEQITRTPTANTKSARTMKIIGIVLTVLGSVVSLQVLSELGGYIYNNNLWKMVADIFPGLGFLVGGIVLLAGSKSMTNRMRRFSKYKAVVGEAPFIEINRLASAAEVTIHRAEEDLEQMIDQGLWGKSAYLDLGKGKLYRSAQAAEEDINQSREDTIKKEAEEGYSGLLRQIRRVNDRISDQTVSAKIERLEELSARIFHLVEERPSKKSAAATFLNYYLPTTLKLLNSYAEFEEAGVNGKNLNEAKARIEHIMDNLVAGFERQLDELYRSDTMDIESDIRVMETMLHRDSAGYEDDFGLGKTTDGK